MDITGARWGLDGAEAVLKLRALRANDCWDDYWSFHLAQERKRVTSPDTSTASCPQPLDVPPGEPHPINSLNRQNGVPPSCRPVRTSIQKSLGSSLSGSATPAIRPAVTSSSLSPLTASRSVCQALPL